MSERKNIEEIKYFKSLLRLEVNQFQFFGVQRFLHFLNCWYFLIISISSAGPCIIFRWHTKLVANPSLYKSGYNY